MKKKKKRRRRRTRPTTAQEQKDRIVSACSFQTIDFNTRDMIGVDLFWWWMVRGFLAWQASPKIEN